MCARDANGGHGGRVLGPDDLDISEHDRVVELGDGRYLISTGDVPPAATIDGLDSETDGDTDDSAESTARRVTEEAVYGWLLGSFEGSETRYGFDLVVKSEDTVAHRRFESNDVVETFERLIGLYANTVDEETATEEVLDILVAESDASLDRPYATVKRLLERHSLTRTDTIGSLLAALDDSKDER